MTVHAYIPARGGSTRVRHKNLQPVGGKSLVRRAVECAQAAGCDEVVVSTDDAEIAAVAAHAGAVVVDRPAELSSGTPPIQIEDHLAHWLRTRPVLLGEADVVVLLQPTSPFRTPETVRRCVEVVRGGYDSALTVCMGHRRNGRIRSHEDGQLRVIWNAPNPLWRPRSQDVVQEPYENGAVYAFSVGHFRRTRCRMGGREGVVVVDRWEAFEIDDPDELAVAQALVTAGVAA